MDRLVIMVPTYNERENIGLMLEALDEISGEINNYSVVILLVDDSSPDGTAEVAGQVVLVNSRLEINLGPKQGLGKALIRGYQYAIDKLNAQIVVSIDCDFLFHPNDIPKLLNEIDNGYDVVLGSRHDENGTAVQGWPMSRYITHWIANDFFGGFIAGNKIVKDHNANFRAIRSEILKRVPWDELPTQGYGFLNYMIYVFESLGAKFKEVKVEMTWRTLGESKVSFNPKYFRTFFRDTKEYIITCFKIRANRWGMKI